ncbi:MAG: hypothetical protein ACJ748_10815 [Flavisolibacter sp.]
MDLLTLSLEELIICYKKAEADLQNALLKGTSWEEVRDKRIIVTKLSQEVWRKREASFQFTPADTPFRED